MKRYTVAIVALSGCILGPACQSIVGIEDRVEAPFDDAGGIDAGNDTAEALDAGGSTDTGSPCPPGATSCLDPDAAPPAGCPAGCLPPAPMGWTGPSATYDGPESTKPTDCPASYTQKDLEGYVGLNAPAATCTCGNAVISGRKCSATVSMHNLKDCSDIGVKEGTASTNTGSCYATTDGTHSTFRVGAPGLVPGTCSFPNATKSTTTAYDKTPVACSQPQAAACENRTDCVNAPPAPAPYTRLCIHEDGDVPCPSADYAVRFVLYKTVDDTRGCSTCTATPAGGACGTTWGESGSQLSCMVDAPPTNMTAGTCYSYPGSGTLVNVGAMSPSAGTCTPSGGTPTGEAKATDPVTFCCNQ